MTRFRSRTVRAVSAVTATCLLAVGGCGTGEASDPQPTTAPAPTGGVTAKPATTQPAPGKPSLLNLGVKPYIDNWSRHAIADGPNAGPAADLAIKAGGTAESVTYLAESCGSASEPKRCGWVDKLDVQVVTGEGMNDEKLVPFTSIKTTDPTPELLKLTTTGKSYFVSESGNRTTITKQQFDALTGAPKAGENADEQAPDGVVTGYVKVTRLRTGLLGVIPPDESEVATHYCSEGVAEADRPKCFMNG